VDSCDDERYLPMGLKVANVLQILLISWYDSALPLKLEIMYCLFHGTSVLSEWSLKSYIAYLMLQQPLPNGA
jgi:hypothetical protein